MPTFVAYHGERHLGQVTANDVEQALKRVRHTWLGLAKQDPDGFRLKQTQLQFSIYAGDNFLGVFAATNEAQAIFKCSVSFPHLSDMRAVLFEGDKSTLGAYTSPKLNPEVEDRFWRIVIDCVYEFGDMSSKDAQKLVDDYRAKVVNMTEYVCSEDPFVIADEIVHILQNTAQKLVDKYIRILDQYDWELIE